MAESDERALLDETIMRSIELYAPQKHVAPPAPPAFASSASASSSGSNFITNDRSLPPNYGYFSGPLTKKPSHTDKRYFSGPIQIKNSATIDSNGALNTIPSLSPSTIRRRPLQQQQQGHHEHLLRSGPLGKCNDPFCTTCPVNFDNDVALYSSFTPEQKVHMNIFGKARKVFDGAHTWGMALVPGVMNPHTKRVQQWNKCFLLSCLFAVFVDPLFFFILSVNEDNRCIFFSLEFAKVITILRSITDLVYLFHILLQFRLAYLGPSSGSASGVLNDNPRDIVRHYLRGWFSLDMIVVIPLPQVMIWVIVPKVVGKARAANYTKNLLRVTVLLQYIPRMIRCVPLLAGNSSTGFIFETAWSNFFINLFSLLLVAHVVGSCWYLFGLQRVNQCLRDACKNSTEPCKLEFLDCGRGGNVTDKMTGLDPIGWANWKKNSNATNCLASSSSVFTYGIYASAVAVSYHDQIMSKYIYSLFWGFQQISTLAGNLMPSMFIGEILFVLGILILGLLLIVLLISNMQNFLLSLSRRRVDMQLKRRDAEAWMASRQLPIDLRRRVREAERFKWAANEGVDEEQLLKGLPEDIEKEIRKALCLDLIKKVRLFTLMENQVLDAICQRLRQRLYIQGSVVLRRNHPVDKMHFFIRGKLRSEGEDGSFQDLTSGDFCGDELLTWCLENDSEKPTKGKKGAHRAVMGQHALSTRTVECSGNVEAFSLSAHDLQEVTKLYSHSLRNARVQGAMKYASPYWRTRAAVCIQVAWRYRKKRQLRSVT